MRVAVTGATGNVGTALVEALAPDPRVSSVLAIARRPSEHAAAPNVDSVSADVARDDLTPLFEGVDAVVHLAWKFQPLRRPTVTWETNVLGSQRVFDSVAAAHVPTLVYASSIGAYRPAPGRVVDESWPTDSSPTAVYGREKAYVERLLDAYEPQHPDVRVVRLRPAFIFQTKAASEQRRIFAGPFAPNSLARRGTLPILPVPSGLRFQAVHASDVADAYRRALMHGVRGAFNIAADPPIDADVLGQLLDARPVTVPRGLVRAGVAAAFSSHLVPVEPGLLDLFLDLPLLDARRARRDLGWIPTRSAPEAFSTFLEGMASGAGRSEPPLVEDSAPARVDELRAGVGHRDVS